MEETIRQYLFEVSCVERMSGAKTIRPIGATSAASAAEAVKKVVTGFARDHNEKLDGGKLLVKLARYSQEELPPGVRLVC